MGPNLHILGYLDGIRLLQKCMVLINMLYAEKYFILVFIHLDLADLFREKKNLMFPLECVCYAPSHE
jgi:hypothetical protein